MPKPAPNSCRDCHRPIRWTPGIGWVHSDPPAEAVRAAERAVRDGVSVRLGRNALTLAQRGELVLLSGTEAERAARLALEAGGPIIAEQARVEERARISKALSHHPEIYAWLRELGEYVGPLSEALYRLLTPADAEQPPAEPTEAIARVRERLDALIADGFGATTPTLRNLRDLLDGPAASEQTGGDTR